MLHSLVLLLTIQLTVGCIDENTRCIPASFNPTTENGAKFVDSTPEVASDGVLGWEFQTRQNWSALITIENSTDPDTYFIGPFNNGDDGPWTDTITKWRQNFACTNDSIVSLEFTLYQCGSWDAALSSIDFFRFGVINSLTQNLMEILGLASGAVPFNVSTPNLNKNAFNAEAECDSWIFKEFGPIELMVNAHQLFQVRFEIGTNSGFEWGAVNNVMVTCTAKDDDGDGFPNSDNNCACDPDKDEDGVNELDASGEPLDNCPNVANQDQADMDGDGVGDACDADKDEDGVNEFDASGKPLDNCPDKYNPYQKDRDHDGKGDKCDYDIDDDGVPNKFDDCPYKKGPMYNKGCPDYGRGGRDDGRGRVDAKGRGRDRDDDGGRNDYGGNRGRGRDDGYGRVDPRDDTGRGRSDGSYSYSGSYSSSSGGGRGRRGSFSGSYSSSSGNSRNGRSGRGYVGSDDYKGGRGGSYKGDERQQLEEMLRQMEEQYRGSSKY